MAECQNCGSHITDDYARVFTPDDVDQPRCCPNCDDLIRDSNGKPRKSRAKRQRPQNAHEAGDGPDVT